VALRLLPTVFCPEIFCPEYIQKNDNSIKNLKFTAPICLIPLILAFLATFAHGQQQKRIAIVNTEDDGEPPIKISELTHITDRLREIANKTLPSKSYAVMTQQSIVAFLGSQENMVNECRAAEGCLAKLGRKINADYIGQARIGRFGEDLTIKVELYESGSGNMVNSFTGMSKDIYSLLSVLDKEAPDLFKKMPGVSGGSAASPFVAGGIGGVQIKGADYEFEGDKRYLASVASNPPGASLSFNGMPDARCTKTPCSVELGEGSVRIIANLEQYEIADTTVSITRNNQSISIRLKPNFGILEIKPAYSDGIGSHKQWALSINGKPNSLGETRLSPNKYSVELSHECYEAVSFEAGINKGSREIFDMAGNLKLKKGGLDLSAERDGEPASEPVYVNGKQIGETPFSGSVPLCADVRIGTGREAVDVKLKQNEKVEHTYKSSNKSFTDERDGKKYRTIAINKQTWMAENLNYNASGSKCYDNNSVNCNRYGRLYNWETAKSACPKGWRLPSKAEWDVLASLAGGRKIAGKYLKAASGWNNNGNGEDLFGFAALPGGRGYSDGSFSSIGNFGYWWSATESNYSNAYSRHMYYYGEEVDWNDYSKSGYLLSIRCVQN